MTLTPENHIFVIIVNEINYFEIVIKRFLNFLFIYEFFSPTMHKKYIYVLSCVDSTRIIDL